MSRKQLKVGDVFEADNSLYIESSVSDGRAAVHEIAQEFNTKAGLGNKAMRLEKGSYVVTNVCLETDYTKLSQASGDELEVILGEYAAEITVVEARKLNTDGSFDPKGQKVKFSQEKGADHYVRDVNIVGKMRQTFVPVGKLKK